MAATPSLGLIVSRRPYQQRVARADIDLALAAAALDFELRVYFLGRSLMQIAASRDPGEAMLPAGYRAWAALQDLAPTRFFAEPRWLEFCAENGLVLLSPPEALDADGMKSHWRDCRHVMVV